MDHSKLDAAISKLDCLSRKDEQTFNVGDLVIAKGWNDRGTEYVFRIVHEPSRAGEGYIVEVVKGLKGSAGSIRGERTERSANQMRKA